MPAVPFSSPQPAPLPENLKHGSRDACVRLEESDAELFKLDSWLLSGMPESSVCLEVTDSSLVK